NNDDTNILSGTPDFNTSADTNSPVAGSPYTISMTNGTLTANNYNFVFVTGQLTVTRAVLTVIADNQSKVYGAPVLELTFAYQGFVNGEDTNVLFGSPTLSTTATATSPAGTYPITVGVTSLSASNYSFAAITGQLTVTPASLTVAANAADRTYDGT